MPEIKRVKRPDWKLFPLPERFSTIPLDQTYSDAESDLIMAGFLPREMEDKWFLFFENDTLFIHRSWTGYCIYQVHFVREGGMALRATHAEANRDPDQYRNTDDAEDAEHIYAIIQGFLLTRE